MDLIEYGTQHPDVIILLHGGGLSSWNYRDAAMLLADTYHVVLPVLDGHAGSDHAFESIEANARRILAYIEENHHGHVLAVGGLSLGAQAAVEVLSQRPDVCRYALIESACLIPDKLTHSLIGPTFSASYPLIRQKWFARLQFRSLHIQPKLFDEYDRDTCRITKPNMIAFMKASTAYRMPANMADVRARLLVVVGSREQRRMKQSAKMLCRAHPNAALYIADGLYHGELSLNYPNDYADLMLRLLKGTP